MSRKHPKHHDRRQAPRSPGAGGEAPVWLHGLHPVSAALANPHRQCLRLVATAEAAPEAERMARARKAASPGVEIADRREIDRLVGPGAVHQGFALQVLPLEEPDLDEAVAGQKIVVVLDQVVDPHNVGAILRSAASFGAAAVIVQDRHSPQATGVLAKAASGALEWVPLVRVGNLARGLDRLKELGYWIVGLDGEATDLLGEKPLPSPVALVLGAEGSGLRRLSREGCDLLVAIPGMREGLSLNVSNAAAVALHEARKQVPKA